LPESQTEIDRPVRGNPVIAGSRISENLRVLIREIFAVEFQIPTFSLNAK
jgi:hypothetical protein